MKSRKILSAVTAAVTALSMLSPITASGSEPAFTPAAGTWLSAEVFGILDNPYKASSADEAVAYVREKMKSREYECSVTLPTGSYKSGSEAMKGVLLKAVSETDKGNEGDYIRFAVKSYNYGYDDSKRGVYTVYYRFTYYSTAEEEKAVDAALEAAESMLDYKDRSDYEKVYVAYDYVTSCAVYAKKFENDRIFTPYGAIIDKNCVCQGFSLLLYRMLKDMGVDCRILSGTSGGERHTWNIARIGDRYFFLDPTWDSSVGGKKGFFFLKGSADFDEYSSDNEHIPVYEYEGFFPDYGSSEFKAAYPQAEKKFILGDADENSVIDGNDASYVLSCYAAMSVKDKGFAVTPVQLAEADVNGDRIVDANDASGLLSYYAAASTGGLNVKGKTISLTEYIRQRR